MSDFTYTPDFVYVEKTSWNTLISKFENGVEQRRKKRSSQDRVFTLSYKTRPASDMSNIKSFFDSKSGAFAAFTWTNLNDSVEYNVRFLEDSFESSLVAPGKYDFSFQFVEDK